MADSLFRINRGISLSAQGTVPANPTNGDLYYDSVANSFVLYNNGYWMSFAARQDLASATDITSTQATVAIMQAPLVCVTGATTTTLHGLSATADGRQILMHNQTGNAITVKNESATETTATNRILTSNGGDATIAVGMAAIFVYDAGSSRWMALPLSAAGGGGGGASTTSTTLVAGETLVTGNPVYISVGGADGGRTAGRVYKVDATNDLRIEFFGVTSGGATAGNTVNIVTAGEITGLSGLVIGSPAFASVTSPGDIQSTIPTTVDQWVIQVGVPTSVTTMIVNGAGSSTSTKITAGIGSVFSGTVLPFAGIAAPAGYLLCDGSPQLISTYPTLYAAISTFWGDGTKLADGTTSSGYSLGTAFNIPDLCGRFLRGVDHAVARDPDRASRTAHNVGGNTGDNVGTLQVEGFKAHLHTGTTDATPHSSSGGANSETSGNRVAVYPGTHTHTFTSNNTGGNETRPLNAGVNYIVKT